MMALVGESYNITISPGIEMTIIVHLSVKQIIRRQSNVKSMITVRDVQRDGRFSELVS